MEVELNPIAQLLDRLEPNEFIPLIRDYIAVLQGLVAYLDKNQSAILGGLDDELRDAESGYDVKYVRDCQSQIRHRILWQGSISRLKSWLKYWENRR